MCCWLRSTDPPRPTPPHPAPSDFAEFGRQWRRCALAVHWPWSAERRAASALCLEASREASPLTPTLFTPPAHTHWRAGPRRPHASISLLAPQGAPTNQWRPPLDTSSPHHRRRRCVALRRHKACRLLRGRPSAASSRRAECAGDLFLSSAAMRSWRGAARCEPGGERRVTESGQRGPNERHGNEATSEYRARALRKLRKQLVVADKRVATAGCGNGGLGVFHRHFGDWATQRHQGPGVRRRGEAQRWTWTCLRLLSLRGSEAWCSACAPC